MFGFLKKQNKQKSSPLMERDLLIPHIKHLRFLHAFEKQKIAKEEQPFATELCGELVIVYAFGNSHDQDSLVLATPSLLEQAGINSAEVKDLAISNLRKQLPEVRFIGRKETPSLTLLHTGDHYEAKLLLIDALWQEIAGRLRGEALVCALHQEAILYADSDYPEALNILHDHIDLFFKPEDPHTLSRQIMRRRNNGWEMFRSE